MGRLIVQIVALLLFMATSSYAMRYALVIGHNNGGSSVNDLHYAELDAQRFASLLITLGGFDPENVITLLHPDSKKLEKQLLTIDKKLHENKTDAQSLLLLYFSGHADGQSLLLGEEHFPLKRIQASLDSLPAQVRIGIFDACQSGALTAFKGGKRAEPFYFKNQSSVKGLIVIASSSALERSQESENLKSSTFTFHWLNGLRGSADQSGDKRVTLNEAYSYAYRKTMETTALTTGEVQHPVYRFNISGQGDIVLTDLNKNESGVVLDKSCEGKFLIMSESYTDVFADFGKKRDQEMKISLVPGDYIVINANGREILTHNFRINDNASYTLSSSLFSKSPYREIRIKGLANKNDNIGDHNESFKNQHPLSIFTTGIGIGAATYPGLQRKTDVVFTSTNQMYLKKNLSLYLDLSYMLSVTGTIEMGLSISAFNGDIHPYASIGAGLQYENNLGIDVADRFAPLFSFHPGVMLDLNRTVSLAFEIPWKVMAYERIRHTIGFELHFLFGGPYRDVMVVSE